MGGLAMSEGGLICLGMPQRKWSRDVVNNQNKNCRLVGGFLAADRWNQVRNPSGPRSRASASVSAGSASSLFASVR